MKLDALDHPKTLDFAARLGVSRPTAIGHLELFWHFVAKQSPQGNVGKFPDGAIARAADWQGDPEAFLQSLLKSGLIDACKTHRFLVHDWPEHCPNWVRAQLQKLKRQFYVADSSSEEGSYEGTGEPSTRARVSKPREAKPREAKPSVGAGSSDPASETNGDAGPNLVIDQVRAIYPAGHYRDSAWLKAAHFVAQRLEEGVEPHELVEAAAKYSDQQIARGKVGTEFVLSPAKFFESEWRGPFPLPPTKAQQQQDANVQASRDWLARSSSG